MPKYPTYLRTVVTTACPLACSFCHMEGDIHREGTPFGLPLEKIVKCLEIAVGAGIKKFKFLGGEPLSRADLPEIISHLRGLSSSADISIITSGVGSTERLHKLFQNGLDRANISIHGWELETFRERGGSPTSFEQRNKNLEICLNIGKPLKLNYVYTGQEEEDLCAFLNWGAKHQVTIGVLNDLTNSEISVSTLEDTLVRLHGSWCDINYDLDPHSFSTTLLTWSDGLTVELKTEELGKVAPFIHCENCKLRKDCREGIFALRLTHTGKLQLCMDRPAISLPLAEILDEGYSVALEKWVSFVRERLV